MLRLRTLIGLSSRNDLVKSLVRDSDPCGFHISYYGNGCIKFSKVQTQRDDLIIKWAAIDYDIHLVYIVKLLLIKGLDYVV